MVLFPQETSGLMRESHRQSLAAPASDSRKRDAHNTYGFVGTGEGVEKIECNFVGLGFQRIFVSELSPVGMLKDQGTRPTGQQGGYTVLLSREGKLAP